MRMRDLQQCWACVDSCSTVEPRVDDHYAVLRPDITLNIAQQVRIVLTHHQALKCQGESGTRGKIKHSKQ